MGALPLKSKDRVIYETGTGGGRPVQHPGVVIDCGSKGVLVQFDTPLRHRGRNAREAQKKIARRLGEE